MRDGPDKLFSISILNHTHGSRWSLLWLGFAEKIHRDKIKKGRAACVKRSLDN
jgi:hypothetical protein